MVFHVQLPELKEGKENHWKPILIHYDLKKLTFAFCFFWKKPSCGQESLAAMTLSSMQELPVWGIT